MTSEFIISSAIKCYMFDPEDKPSFAIFTGKRHADILHRMYIMNIKYDKATSKQGFFTSKNRFLDRREACTLALKNKQVTKEKIGYRDYIFSEDLW